MIQSCNIALMAETNMTQLRSQPLQPNPQIRMLVTHFSANHRWNFFFMSRSYVSLGSILFNAVLVKKKKTHWLCVHGILYMGNVTCENTIKSRVKYVKKCALLKWNVLCTFARYLWSQCQYPHDVVIPMGIHAKTMVLQVKPRGIHAKTHVKSHFLSGLFNL